MRIRSNYASMNTKRATNWGVSVQLVAEDNLFLILINEWPPSNTGATPPYP